MNETPKHVITTDRPTSRRPYEAPRLEVVDLRPEEQLLTCAKSVPTFPCDLFLTIS